MSRKRHSWALMLRMASERGWVHTWDFHQVAAERRRLRVEQQMRRIARRAARRA